MNDDVARTRALDLGLAPAFAGPGVMASTIGRHKVGASAPQCRTDVSGRLVHDRAPKATRDQWQG